MINDLGGVHPPAPGVDTGRMGCRKMNTARLGGAQLVILMFSLIAIPAWANFGEFSRRGNNSASLPGAGQTRRASPARENNSTSLSGAGKDSASFSARTNSAHFPAPGTTRRVLPVSGKITKLCPRREDSPSFSRTGKVCRFAHHVG